MPTIPSRVLRSSLTFGLAALLAACAGMSEPSPSPRKELAYALTENNELIKFNTGEPQRILERQPLKGLRNGDQLIGMGVRSARGTLYTLAQSGRLYTLNPATAELTVVGTGAPPPGTASFGTGTGIAGIQMPGSLFGLDFNPAADDIRVVSDLGLNLRLQPDTGLAVDGDPKLSGTQPDAALHYVAGDANAGKNPALVAAGHSGDAADPKRTTLYAIDRDLGVLVVQGSRAGETPVVSPDTGDLRTVGPLGLGRLRDASLDIAEATGTAFALLRTAEDLRARLYTVDLKTGKARLLGTVDQGRPLLGLAIAP